MPFKDPKKKLAYQAEWRKRSIRNGYGKWLYDRRALRFADADHFREALQQIASGSTDARKIAQAALAASAEREEAVGPSPIVTPNPKPSPHHPTRPPDGLLEILASLEK